MATQGKLNRQNGDRPIWRPHCSHHQSLVGAVLAAAQTAQHHRHPRRAHGIARHQWKRIHRSDHAKRRATRTGRHDSGSGAGFGAPEARQGRMRKGVRGVQEERVRYFFYIGGKRFCETAHIIAEMAKEANYDFCTVHIPKTSTTI